MTNAIYKTSAHIATATATAILLSFPTISGDYSNAPQEKAHYQPLDEKSRQHLIDRFSPSVYMLGKSSNFFELMSEIAIKLVKESKPLDEEFSKIVDKEFWNLLS
jgi:hypothetical protein